LHVPDRLAQAFQGRTTLNLREAAAALEMDPRQLRAAVRAGRVRFVQHGRGQARVQRRFLLADLVTYLDTERRLSCPSTSPRARGSTGATSASRASAFDALREKLTAARPRWSRSD
jgi:hypothetical protein